MVIPAPYQDTVSRVSARLPISLNWACPPEVMPSYLLKHPVLHHRTSRVGMGQGGLWPWRESSLALRGQAITVALSLLWTYSGDDNGFYGW